MAGAGCLEPRLCLIEFLRRDRLLIEEHLHSAECRFGQLQLRLGCRDSAIHFRPRTLCLGARGLGLPGGCFEIASVENGHHLSGLHGVPWLHADFADAAHGAGREQRGHARLHSARRLVGHGHVDQSRRLRIHAHHRRGLLRFPGAVGAGAAAR